MKSTLSVSIQSGRESELRSSAAVLSPVSSTQERFAEDEDNAKWYDSRCNIRAATDIIRVNFPALHVANNEV